VSAELAARATAAAAANADFRRVTDEYLDRGGPVPDWSAWAFRLSAELTSLTDAAATIGDQQS
jgi:hypothetical protein